MKAFHALAISVVFLGLLFPAGIARADDHSKVDIDGWYFKPGLELSAIGLRDRGAGLAIGPVLSLVYLDEKSDVLPWYGIQADVLVDSNGDADAGARWSLGPQAGVVIFGGDVSYFGERVGGQTYHGIAGRAKLSFVLFGFYVRVAHVFDSPDGTSLEGGAYIKLPIRLTGKDEGEE
jgi:hypothetical protein